jgi:hypothetical protein
VDSEKKLDPGSGPEKMLPVDPEKEETKKELDFGK